MDDKQMISALLHPAAAATLWAAHGSALDARQRRAAVDAVRARIAEDVPAPVVDLELGEIESLRHALRAHVEEVVPPELRADAHLRVGVVIDALVADAAARRLTWLEANAMVDPLTGLGNRRSAARSFEAALAYGQRHHTPVAVAMVDIVGLKSINDENGHAAGDAALVALADSLRTSMRADDDAFRFGGDEFVVLAPGSTAGELARLFDRMRLTAPPFTVGIAELPIDGTTEAALIAVADERMYAQRHLGVAVSLAAVAPRRRRLTTIAAVAALAVLALGAPVLAWTLQLVDDPDRRGGTEVSSAPTTTNTTSATSAGRPTIATTTTTATTATTATTGAPPTSAVTPVGGRTVGGAVTAETPPTSTVRPATSVVAAPTTTPTTTPTSTPRPTTTTTIEPPYNAAGDRQHGKPNGPKPNDPKPKKHGIRDKR